MRKELTLEEIAAETGIDKAAECLADYLACRRALLEEYGQEHFLDLYSVVPEPDRKKLDYLMSRYAVEARKKEQNIA